VILGPNSLNERIANGLIEGLPDGYQAKGLCVDLRCDQLFAHYGGANLDKLHRATGSTNAISHSKEQQRFRLRPGAYYLARTIETVNMPEDLAAICIPRSTAFRSGFHIGVGFVDPGYHGMITFSLANLTPELSFVQRGFPLIQICFFKATEPSELYNGIYQGGTIAAG